MDAPTAPRPMDAVGAAFDGAVRVGIIGRHAVPIVRAWAGLIRAEGDLARDGLAGLLIATAIAFVAALVFLSALIGGAMLGLHGLGWPVWAATALPVGIGLSVLAVAGWFAYGRWQRLSFPETRRRFGALLEVLDEP